MVSRRRVLLLFSFVSLALILASLAVLRPSVYRSTLRSALSHNSTRLKFNSSRPISSSAASLFNQSSTAKMSAKSSVESLIAENHIAVFSKSYCPYCKKTKDLLASLGEKYAVVELDQIEDGSDWQAYLGDKTGQRTVPSVFINQQHIGGNSDLQAKHASGELKKLLGAKM
ncbi:thioredoxin-like protein [Leucosporidium creatinivorum]|uniref:glutathione peroxidase n=1 Tax=Leucosporidium creatinivorum TaxID=106004 RepID=A0A1Y2FJJ0_9BASI|nr:thioredoxin-like protein [Leucosporidium creatinivorum]